MITTVRYAPDQIELIALEDLLALSKDGIPEGEFLWVDMYRPTPEEETQILKDWFPITDLHREDASRAKASSVRGEHHFPKVEESEDYLFLILRGAIIPDRHRDEELPQFLPRIMGGQLNIFMNHRVIITHRFEEMHIVERVQRVLHRNRRFVERGPDFAVAEIMDATVDDAIRIAQLIEERLGQLEVIIMERVTNAIWPRG